MNTAIVRRTRKRLEGHSRDMNEFLVNESLDEQLDGYNTTFLAKNDNGLILAYMSLCTDAIRLNHAERNNGQIGYETFPSLKIARLAVHKDYQRIGLGKNMIKYAVHKSLQLLEDFCGVKFLTLDCFPHRLGYYVETIGFVQNQESSEDLISLRLNIDEYLDRLV
ncbi:GNAT family N-acetyltransferase [Paenibacillus agri]|uniref:GNAT family N-acetyltransferase n=1 Tax=Paenibacillus agri TaxID=2744309 RepID=A0A850ESW7_9BACL|nr:GNAT family N-acetyltransferase [Paenibacillus agri]NUU62617.1 GNAT family N-acetyltransferase [Paenibacillus agri]